jgi:hypothetical protein
VLSIAWVFLSWDSGGKADYGLLRSEESVAHSNRIKEMPPDLITKLEVADNSVVKEELERLFGRGTRFLLARKGVSDVDAGVDWILDIVLQRFRAGELESPEKLSRAVRTVLNDYAQGVAVAEWAALDRHEEPVKTRDTEMQRIVGTLFKLPARDREAIMRFYLQEEPLNKICSDLGLAERTFLALRTMVLSRVRGRRSNRS